MENETKREIKREKEKREIREITITISKELIKIKYSRQLIIKKEKSLSNFKLEKSSNIE